MASSSGLPLGCRFSPSDADLISVYLRLMIAREPLPEPAARFLHTADAYAADPATLVSGFLPAVLPAPKNGVERRCWYFFGSAKALSGHDKRRSRTVGGGEGTWHAEKGREAVLDGEGRGGVVGYKQSFRYKPSNADGSVETVWLMIEFRMAAHDQGDDEKGETVPVLCKVYQSPRKPRSASISTLPAYRRERKRKARDDSTPVTTVKRRLLVPPAAPILPPAVEPHPDLNNYSDGVSVDQLLEDPMSGLTPDQVLGDFVMPLPESDVNCSFSMAKHAGSAVSSYCDEGGAGARTPFSDNSDQILLGDLLMPFVPESEVNYSFSMSDDAGSAVSSYCARNPSSDNFGQVLLGDLLMPVPESEVNYSFSMPDHAGSVVSNHSGDWGMLFFENSNQVDFLMPAIEQLPAESLGQTAMLNCSFLPCAPNAGISGSWTGGDTTDDEAASISWWNFMVGLCAGALVQFLHLPAKVLLMGKRFMSVRQTSQNFWIALCGLLYVGFCLWSFCSCFQWCCSQTELVLTMSVVEAHTAAKEMRGLAPMTVNAAKPSPDYDRRRRLPLACKGR